jgi:hypothetical protein
MAENSVQGVVDASAQQLGAQEEKQKREMGATADQVFSSHNQDAAVRRLHQRRQAELQRMTRMDWPKASVVNLMPFPLNVNGVIHARLAEKDGHQVPACKVGEDYVHFVIKDLHWTIRDDGAGMDNVDNYTPLSVAPMELAEDYRREFLDRMGVGGVIVYAGDAKPDSEDLKQKLAEARLARNEWLMRKVREAETDWADASGNGRKNITELHRKAAEVLLYDRMLKHQPAWLLAVNAADGALPDPCPGCGEVADPRAVLCKSCRYVFSPVAAYKAAVIEYDHVSMQRLKKEEWVEVNKIKAERDEARKEAMQSGDRT